MCMHMYVLMYRCRLGEDEDGAVRVFSTHAE